MYSISIKYFFLSLGIIMISCVHNKQERKYKDQVKTVETLIHYLTTNDDVSVRKLIGTDLASIGMNDEILLFNIHKANEYLRDHKISSKSDFKFKEYPKDDALLVDIAVPLENHESGGDRIYLVIYFEKYIEKGGILNFRIIEDNSLLNF